MPTIEIDGAVIDYDIIGETGPLVVQLHGLTSSRERDGVLGLDLGRSLRGHRVLRYDARGHGASTGDLDPESYRWDRLASDLLALLDHVAPNEVVHGVGPSMGSATLLHAAVREPERFGSLTLALPPTAWSTRVTQAAGYHRNADLVERAGIGAFVELGGTAPVPPALVGAPVTRPTVAESLLPTVLRGAASTDFPDPIGIAGITAPTLILAWVDDPSHPESTARALSGLIPNATMVLARTPYGITAWPGLFAEHVTVASRAFG